LTEELCDRFSPLSGSSEQLGQSTDHETKTPFGEEVLNLINIPSGTLKRGQMTLALPKALTFE